MKKNRYINFVVIIWLICFFLIPRDFEYLKIFNSINFNNFRIFCLVITIPLFLQKNLIPLIILTLIINVYSFLSLGRIETSYWFIVCAIALINNIEYSEHASYKNPLLIISILYLITIIKNSFTYGFFVSNSFDANYTGLQSIVLCLLLTRLNQRFLAFVILGITFFSYSRLYILVLLIFILFYFIPSLKKSLPFFKRNLIFHLIVFNFLALFISFYVYVVIFNSQVPEYIYYDGLNRFSRLLDTSNWIRVAANIRFIENLEIFTFLFGDIYGLSLEFSEFKGKFITPHNLLLSILYNSGILYTLIYYHTYLKYAGNFIFLHILLIPYHLILGFGAYYGFILLILAIFKSKNISSEKSVINWW